MPSTIAPGHDLPVWRAMFRPGSSSAGVLPPSTSDTPFLPLFSEDLGGSIGSEKLDRPDDDSDLAPLPSCADRSARMASTTVKARELTYRDLPRVFMHPRAVHCKNKMPINAIFFVHSDRPKLSTVIHKLYTTPIFSGVLAFAGWGRYRSGTHAPRRNRRRKLRLIIPNLLPLIRLASPFAPVPIS